METYRCLQKPCRAEYDPYPYREALLGDLVGTPGYKLNSRPACNVASKIC